MLLDAVLLATLTIFILVGLFRGALVAGISLISLALAYFGAAWAAQSLGGPIASELGVSEFYAVPLAGGLAFFGIYTLMGLIGWGLQRWDRERLEDEPRGFGDRLLGGCFGALRGSLIVLLLGWLALWVDAARDLEVIAAIDAIPQTEESHFARLTGRTVASVMKNLLADDDGEAGAGGRVITQLASSPGTALRGLKDLLEDPHVSALQQDPMFWTLIENGASERALNRSSFYRIAHNEGLRADLADLGLISSEAASNIDVFRAEAAAVFDQVGPRLKGLRDDPEIQRLARDPEIVDLLRSGNTLALIQRPEIRNLVDRISAEK